tara:strand:- start:2857 stop:3456 length:600 start_codon:yes stop_codon:yes gene_type:complete
MAGIFTTSEQAKGVDEAWDEAGMPTNQGTLKKMIVRQDLLNALDPTQQTIDPVEAEKIKAGAIRTFRQMTKLTPEQSAQMIAQQPGGAPLPQTDGEEAAEAAAGAEAAVLTDFDTKRKQARADAVLAATGQAPSYASQLLTQFGGTVATQSMPALLEDMLGLENELKGAATDDINFNPTSGMGATSTDAAGNVSTLGLA